MLTKTASLVLYPAAQVLWLDSYVMFLAVVGYRKCMLYCEGGSLQIRGTTCDAFFAAVTSQLCIVVVSCCSGSMVGQLLYWLGCWI